MRQELLQDNFNTGQLSRSFIRDGVNGNLDTVFQMIRITRESVRYDKGLEKFAKELLIKNDLDSYSKPSDIITVIYAYVNNSIKYIQDVAGNVEEIKSPRRTISDGYGDCDDIAILIAALCGCIGFETVYFIMAGYDNNVNENGFAHIYVRVLEKGQSFTLDATLPNDKAKVNREVKTTIKREIEIFHNVTGLDGVSGIYTNARHTAKKTLKGVIEIMPKISAFLPIDFLSNTAFSTGAEMLANVNNQRLSLNAVASRINKQLDEIILELMKSKIAYDLAKAKAAQIVAQLTAIELTKREQENLDSIKESIKEKFDFIKNFPTYAKENNIKLVNLSSNAMLIASAAGLAIGGYAAYKVFFAKD